MSFLRLKLRANVRQKTNTENTDETEIQPLSPRDRMKLYRERIKESPALYKAYREKEAARGRQYRASLNEMKKADQREKTRLRVQKWRKKNQNRQIDLQNEATSKPKKVFKTREQKKSQKEKWRLYKQKQRANLTSQKKRRINEKRRAKYAEKKQAMKTNNRKHPNTESHKQEDEGYKTDQGKRKAVYRAKQTLPYEPKKFAQVISKLTESASPRKRKALEEQGFFTPAEKKRHIDFVNKYQKEMQETKMKRSEYYLARRRHIASIVKMSNKDRAEFGFSWGFAHKASQIDGIWERKKNKNAMDESEIEKVQQYFKKSGISTCLPDKKLVSTKTMEPRRILENSLKQTYCNFKEENPDTVVSFPKFVSLRPKSVKTMDKNHFNGCLCEYCTNLEMKVNTLRKAVPKVKGKEKEFEVKSRYDLLKMTLCQRKEGAKFHERKCIDRTCSKCGPKKLETQLKSLTKSDTIEWSRWENQIYTHYKDNKKRTRKMLRIKQGTLDAFLKELVDEIQPYSLHIHVASWQHYQFNQLVNDVPPNWVVFCMDYSENYQCLYQDEAQSAHWSHDQATLFSIVAYSKCPACKENMHESLVFVSDEKQHDSHAVHHYVTLANQHLLETRKLTIEREIHFSDGASAQFKSRTPFADVAHSVDDYGFPCEKHFFGSRHGKGPCDGEFGVIKRSVSMAVLARRAVVRNAREFFYHCSTELTKPKVHSTCCHARRTFFYVQESEIPPKRSRSDRINAKTVSQTRKQHAIKPRAKIEGGVCTRLLSCFCKFCISSQEDQCLNIIHVDDWQPQNKKDDLKVKKGISKAKKDSSNDRKGSSRAKKEYSVAEKRYSNIRLKSKKESQRIKQVTKGKGENDERDESKNVEKLILECSKFSDLKMALTKLDIEQLPLITAKTFLNTACVVDNDTLPLVPEDIPLKPKSQLFPCVIYGDGNCLPRSASVLVYGSEQNHVEMRKRMVIELTINEAYYLDQMFMRKGKQDNAQDDVPKAFAHLSSFYMGHQLTKRDIKSIYEKEIMEIRKSGAYMGMWQIACLANILRCPVVSVCPTYGTKTVRKDMHRVFYPFREEYHASQPVFIMWTSLGGVQKEEKDFSLNHFDVLMPMTNTETVDAEFSDFSVDDSFELSDSTNSSILNIITDLMTNIETPVDVPSFGRADSEPVDVSKVDGNNKEHVGVTLDERSNIKTVNVTLADCTGTKRVDDAMNDPADMKPVDITMVDGADKKILNLSLVDRNPVDVGTNMEPVHVRLVDKADKKPVSVPLVYEADKHKDVTIKDQANMKPVDVKLVEVADKKPIDIALVDGEDMKPVDVTLNKVVEPVNVALINGIDKRPVDVTLFNNADMKPVNFTLVNGADKKSVNVTLVNGADQKAVDLTLVDRVEEEHVDVTLVNAAEKKSVDVTQVNGTDENAVDITLVNGADKKYVDITLVDRADKEIVDFTLVNWADTKYVDVTMVDRTDKEPADITRANVADKKAVDITDFLSAPLTSVDVTLVDRADKETVDMTLVNGADNKPVDVTLINGADQKADDLTLVNEADKKDVDFTPVDGVDKKPEKKYVDITLVDKADKETVNFTPVNGTDKKYVDITLVDRADKETVDMTLANVADKKAVDITDFLSAPLTSVDVTLVDRGDKETVDMTLVNGADKKSLDLTLVNGADKKYVDITLVDRADQETVDNTLVNGAEKKSLDLTLVNGADKKYVDITLVDRADQETVDNTLVNGAEKKSVDLTLVNGADKKYEGITLVDRADQETVDNTLVNGADKEPLDVTMEDGADKGPLDVTMVDGADKEPLDVTMVDGADKGPLDVTMVDGADKEPLDITMVNGTDKKNVDITLVDRANKEPLDITMVDGADKVPLDVTMFDGADKEPLDVTMVDGADKGPLDVTMVDGADKEPLDVTMVDGADKEPLDVTMVDGADKGPVILDGLADTDDRAITKMRIETGDYLLVNHGQCVYPAVVENWPWVRFFKKKKMLWSLNEIGHTTDLTDIKCKIPPPEIVMCGRRQLYHFKDV